MDYTIFCGFLKFTGDLQTPGLSQHSNKELPVLVYQNKITADQTVSLKNMDR